jgi:hypothetical protein
MSFENNVGGEGMNIPPELERAVRQEMERRQRVQEAVTHFYTGDYVSLNNLEGEVLAVSWKGANELLPMVLLCKAKRTELGVEVGDVVKVEADGKSLPCLVERQFKSMKEGVTVNRVVAHVLGLKAKVVGQGEEGTGAVAGSTVKVSSLL